jgi:hypothetical protein
MQFNARASEAPASRTPDPLSEAPLLDSDPLSGVPPLDPEAPDDIPVAASGVTPPPLAPEDVLEAPEDIPLLLPAFPDPPGLPASCEHAAVIDAPARRTHNNEISRKLMSNALLSWATSPRSLSTT